MALQKVPGRAIQLDSQVSSDIMYHNGADWVRLAKGEAGQVLVVNDAGTFPQWGTSDWVYRGSIRGFSMGGANHHDLPGGGGTGVWYFFSDIYSHEFASDGNAVDSTGDLVAPSHAVSGFSSETHSFVAGGRNNTNSASVNTIQSFQNTNPSGNATDLADLTVVNHHMTPVSGLTHGYATGGEVSATTLEKFAFANTANATLVGNLPNTHSGTEGGGVTDSTADYGYIAGSGSPQVNHISRFSFANETTTDDVGDVTAVSGHASGASSETHGYFLGAGDGFTNLDKYIFASSANATDVGNLYHGASLWGGAGTGGARGNGMSSMTHGYCAGGELYTDIGKFAFANESNTTDVGDLGSGLTTLRAHHASSHF
jgi:hypothetical protein